MLLELIILLENIISEIINQSFKGNDFVDKIYGIFLLFHLINIGISLLLDVDLESRADVVQAGLVIVWICFDS